MTSQPDWWHPMSNLSSAAQGRLKAQAAQARVLGPKKKDPNFFVVLIYLKKIIVKLYLKINFN